MEKRKAEFQARNTLNAVFEHYFETIIESRYAQINDNQPHFNAHKSV